MMSMRRAASLGNIAIYWRGWKKRIPILYQPRTITTMMRMTKTRTISTMWRKWKYSLITNRVLVSISRGRTMGLMARNYLWRSMLCWALRLYARRSLIGPYWMRPVGNQTIWQLLSITPNVSTEFSKKIKDHRLLHCCLAIWIYLLLPINDIAY